MGRRVFNMTAIIVACVAIIWATSFFYSEAEQNSSGTGSSLGAFARKVASGIAIGIAASLFLAVINMFLNRIFDSTNKVGIRKLLLVSMCSTAAAAVVGTAVFFWL